MSEYTKGFLYKMQWMSTFLQIDFYWATKASPDDCRFLGSDSETTCLKVQVLWGGGGGEARRPRFPFSVNAKHLIKKRSFIVSPGNGFLTPLLTLGKQISIRFCISWIVWVCEIFEELILLILILIKLWVSYKKNFFL